MAIVAISRLHKTALIGIGAVRSLRHCHIDKSVNKYVDVQPWTRNYVPTVKWDYNWDQREPKSLVKPPEPGNPEDEKRYNEEIEKEKCKSVHHLFLIRSAQYSGKQELRQDHLTELGKQQAELTGKKLKSVPSHTHCTSSLLRAEETSNIIMKQTSQSKMYPCKMLAEGIPIPSEPPSKWASDGTLFHDSARLEAAFRIYFHRDWASALNKDRYTIIVSHSNAIRYFVCRALQFPPEGWSRMSLNHCSITSLSIQPNGEVILRALNDTGHMEPKLITC